MDESFELRDLVAVISRQRKLIGLLLCAAVVLALLINNIIPPVYQASATMRVKYAQNGTEANPSGVTDEQMKQQIDTYAEIVKSRAVVEAVIDKQYANSATKPSYESVVKGIDAQQVKSTEILNISFQAGSPEEAQQMANELVDAFNERMTEIVRFENNQARVFLSQSLAEAKTALDKAEKALVEYKKANGIVALNSQTNLFIEKQATLARQNADNQLALASNQAKLSNINRQISHQSNEFIADSPLIQQYKSKLADQETELAGLQKTMTASHPRVVALQASIDATTAKLKAEISKIASHDASSNNPVYQSMLQSKIQAEVDLAVSQVQRSVLSQQSNDGKKDLLQLPVKEQGLARLQMEYSVAESAYMAVSKRYDDARIVEMTQPTNIQLVDPASLPEKPIKPQRLVNLAVAVLLGLFAGISLAFIADYFYKTIDSTADMRRYLGIPVIGSIPRYNTVLRRSQTFWSDLWNNLIPGKRRTKRRFKHAEI